MVCPSCGADNPDRARFCAACGHALGQLGDERRFVTMLFADLVGFTSLSERRDPETVKNLVDAAFERLAADITEFGGVVDKIVGDALLALFGAPTAHEDDPERAVRAGLQMQRTLAEHADRINAEIRMRIGVNSGEVLVGQLRAGGDWTAMGDVVNIASRLQAAAEPGEVLVGPATYGATVDAITYEPRGLTIVKGRDDPVEVFAAIATLRPPGYRDRQSTASLVGRDDEFAMLTHALDAAVAHRRAHVVLLRGEAGVGKSRLASDAARWARHRHGAHVLVGRCVPYGEANVWWPLAELIRNAAELPNDAPAESVAAAVRGLVDRLFSELDSGENERLVNGLMHLLGLENPLRQIDPGRARDELARSVLAISERSAEVKPLVVRISDVHWARPEVTQLLDELLARLGRTPFVMIVTARPGDEVWHPAHGSYNLLDLNLEPLGRDAAESLLDQLLGAETPSALRQDILDRSGGNPFFLEELVSLVESCPDEDAMVPSDLPDTLRGIVAARLDALTAGERAVTEDAAVWGRSGPVEVLERMAEGQGRSPEMDDLLYELQQAEIMEVGRGRWRFRSDSVREVAYARLTKSARRKRHRGIAEHLGALYSEPSQAPESVVDVLARHLGAVVDLSEDLDDDVDMARAMALPWVEEAAERALGRDLHRLAADLHAQALRLLPADASEARVTHLLSQASALSELWEIDEADGLVAEAELAARESDNARGRARVVMLRGELEARRGEYDDSRRSFGEAARAYETLGDRKGVADVERRRGLVELFASDFEAAESHIEAALDGYRATGERMGEGWALQTLAWIAFVSGHVTDAERWARESSEVFAELGDAGGLAWVNGLQAFILFHRGEAEEAERMGRSMLKDAADRGDHWGEGMLHMLLGSIALFVRGDVAVAIEEGEAARRCQETTGDENGRSQAVTLLGRALLAAGRVDEAFTALTEWTPLGPTARAALAVGVATAAAHVGEPQRDPHSARDAAELDAAALGDRDRLIGRGLLLTQLDRADEGHELLTRVRAASDAKDPSMYAGSAVALSAAVVGADDEATQNADEVLGHPGATYLDRGLARLAMILVAARRGDSAEAQRWFNESATEVDSTQDVVAQATLRVVAARAWQALDQDRRMMLEADAAARLSSLRTTMSGWRQLAETALSGATAAA